MKRNWRKPVVAAVALSLVAAACGDNDDEPAADEPAEDAADEENGDE